MLNQLSRAWEAKAEPPWLEVTHVPLSLFLGHVLHILCSEASPLETPGSLGNLQTLTQTEWPANFFLKGQAVF